MALGVALSLALVASACGTRANKAQIAEALGAGAGSRAGTGSASPVQNPGAVSGSGAQTGSVDTSVTGQVTPGAASGQPASAAATGAAGASGSSANDVIAAPASGNGGATDIGVTANTITAANISILTGPVPGLFTGAVNGTDAFFQYQNSLGGVYGRQLKLLVGDDQFDCGQNKALTEAYAPKVLAFVGGFSLFDDCGAEVFDANPNLVDVHDALAKGAQVEKNNFAPDPIRPGLATGPYIYFKNLVGDAVKSSASLIGDVQAAKDAWTGEQAGMESLGYHFVFTSITEPTQTDFTAEIVRMKAANVRALILVAEDVKTIARVESKADQQNFHPTLTAFGASAYDPTLQPLAGSARVLEGAYVTLPTNMYLGEDRSWNSEVDLFLTWLKRTHPDANADLFTVFGWASARMFVDALKTAGTNVTRQSLLAALRNIHHFDANGLIAPADPANKVPPTCYVIVRIRNGNFVRVDDPPNALRCDGSYFYYNG